MHVEQAANAVMQRQADRGQGGGSIIMVGSVSGSRPSPGAAAYGAAKAGLHHLVTSLAIEWGPAVRVNCVVPGFVANRGGRRAVRGPRDRRGGGGDGAAAPDGDPG